LFKLTLKLAAIFALSIVIWLGTLLFNFWSKLPEVEPLLDNPPLQPLRVYTADGHLIKEIGEERCTIIKIEDVPLMFKQALLAAEDENFYEHGGLNLSRIVSAIFSNLRSGGRGQGSSTITMQVVRNSYLLRERRASRHLSELLLAIKIDRTLTKDQILGIYINRIYLGQRSYGFGAAAQTYFGKTLSELSLAEAAMLAGLPKGPSIYNPIVNPTAAKRRQRYVLRRMLDIGYIDESAYQQALEEPIKTVDWRAARDAGAGPVHAEYVAEIARQIAVGRFGEQATRRGLRVITTITRAEQEAAYEALRRGLMEYDRRHGYRGPEKTLKLPDGPLTGEILDAAFAKAHSDADDEDNDPLRDYGDLLLAVVTEVRPKEVTVYRSGQFIKITGSGLSFAAPMLKPDAPQERQVRRGALVRIRNTGGKGWELTQIPEVEGALVSLDSRTGAVRALVGGFDFNRSRFNNVTQDRRQPGSSFQPFIDSASLEKTGHVQGYIANFGFDTARNPPDLLVSPWEMATAYAVFANGGYRVNPFVVKEIVDADGNRLAQVDPLVAGERAPRVIDARNARIMDAMLRDGVRRGDGSGLRALGRNDIAGRVGTTNDHSDAWFCGYNPETVAVVWLGFPVPRNMGSGETGGTAALPIWINYMRPVLGRLPETELPRPDGIGSAPVDAGMDSRLRGNDGV
jgi:penicillin-binding protein 1A